MQKKPSAVKMQFKMAFLLLCSSVLGYSVELLSLQWSTKLCTDLEIRKLLNTILHVTSVLWPILQWLFPIFSYDGQFHQVGHLTKWDILGQIPWVSHLARLTVYIYNLLRILRLRPKCSQRPWVSGFSDQIHLQLWLNEHLSVWVHCVRKKMAHEYIIDHKSSHALNCSACTQLTLSSNF